MKKVLVISYDPDLKQDIAESMASDHVVPAYETVTVLGHDKMAAGAAYSIEEAKQALDACDYAIVVGDSIYTSDPYDAENNEDLVCDIVKFGNAEMLWLYKKLLEEEKLAVITDIEEY